MTHIHNEQIKVIHFDDLKSDLIADIAPEISSNLCEADFQIIDKFLSEKLQSNTGYIILEGIYSIHTTSDSHEEMTYQVVKAHLSPYLRLRYTETNIFTRAFENADELLADYTSYLQDTEFISETEIKNATHLAKFLKERQTLI